MVKKFILGPRLFRINKSGPNEESYGYVPNTLEMRSDQFIKTLKFFKAMSIWTSPFVISWLYNRKYFSLDGSIALFKLSGYLFLLVAGTLILRGLGRRMNADYVRFISILEEARNSKGNEEALKKLRRYDFEFFSWPTDFSITDVEEKKDRSGRNLPPLEAPSFSRITSFPVDFLSYIAVHSFGKRMVYPGATGLISVMIDHMLVEGRIKLYEDFNGKRAKLITRDNNDIDTMFVDRKSLGTEQGKTLVITSEGNAGFYEVGCMITPLEGGYSVLGWNHPGFGGSTGFPMPSQDQNAIDTVMQYAINKLGFQPENIILFAWSIGGYPATWAAMNYPDIKGVVLDATFDDLVPLAISKMPQSLSWLIKIAIRKYLDLRNADQLLQYPGPVLLIRRRKDEIITTSMHPELGTNRGNDLLIKLLEHRYPKIVDQTTKPFLKQWLSGTVEQQAILLSTYDLDADECEAMFNSYVSENSCAYPMLIGENFDEKSKIKLALFLASKYMEDFDSNHTSPLPARFLHQPWSPVAPS